jgi:regulator of replication initiation timing
MTAMMKAFDDAMKAKVIPVFEENERLRLKLDKLKALILLTDKAVSGESVSSLTIRQWSEFVKAFPDELVKLKIGESDNYDPYSLCTTEDIVE